ncbi:MAG: hypothetical protein KAJ19_16515 [Gammaproteobacteria bacterium]|nr:hypothetical protein [Gammaproteobacteria bacterium]
MFEAVMSKDGKSIVLTVPIRQKAKLSDSGKNYTLATTGGNIETELEVDGQTVKVGVNAFYRNREYVKPVE